MQEVQNEHRRDTGSSSDTVVVIDDKAAAEKGPEAATEIKDEPALENGSSKASRPLRVLIVAQHVSHPSPDLHAL